MLDGPGERESALRPYVLVTAAYWGFTITDGALRMLVLLYFHDLGYSPVSLAFLFLLYEFFGVVTNLVGGWIGARHGLYNTLVIGLALQIGALGLLSLHRESWAEWLAVAWVMSAQALSGIAKDFTKMSAKTAVKFVAGEGKLFSLVAALTGSKNALKGAGFFVGAALLGRYGFDQALWILAALVAVALVVVLLGLNRSFGQSHAKPKLSEALRKSPAITRLAVARFFLFGSRDIWFVVALPVFLDDVLGWSFEAIGTFLAFWVIGYGIAQALAPRLPALGEEPHLRAASLLVPLATVTASIALLVFLWQLPALATVLGLVAFGVIFAQLSAVHSYLVLAYSTSDDDVAMDVGFYYSANAAGRLVGTLLSGVLYLVASFEGALVGTVIFLLAAYAVSLRLPAVESVEASAESDSTRSEVGPA